MPSWILICPTSQITVHKINILKLAWHCRQLRFSCCMEIIENLWLPRRSRMPLLYVCSKVKDIWFVLSWLKRHKREKWNLGSLPKPNLRILSSSRYKDPLFLETACSSSPPDTQEPRMKTLTTHDRCFYLLYDQWEKEFQTKTRGTSLNDDCRVRATGRVHSPDVCPCRECVFVCVCCVRSMVRSIWNMRRSSSSKAMSPQNAAGRSEKNTCDNHDQQQNHRHNILHV